MKSTLVLLTLSLVLVAVKDASAQSDRSRDNSIAVQPVLSFDNLLPTELIGLSAQYEFAISSTSTMSGRIAWFRDPLVGSAISGSNGYALSFGYQHYFSNNTAGWHIGPFTEWIVFQHIGSIRSNFRGGADIGAIGGHKWKEDRFVFDIAARTAWYSPTTFPRGRYFPSVESRFKSQLILSIGYLVD